MNLDRAIQERLKTHLTVEDAFPTRMPIYVNSFGYFFGTMTLSSLALVVGSGVILAVFGPNWWHVSAAGAFLNALHFWSVEIFYFSAILHMLFKFFTAAWRGGRFRTWVLGWLIFVTSIFSGITGTLLQANWDSQWNAQQGKDAFNALGLDWMHWLNYSEDLTLHVALFAGLVMIFAASHLFAVRSESPVRPIVNGGKDPAGTKAGTP
jgi:quinol-cytochrome oxidoreductase complex cytochrome b subunit